MIIKKDMPFSHALVIAANFDNENLTDEKRLKAIQMIKDAPTLNSVPKDKLQSALNWLFDYCFVDAELPITNFEKIQNMTIEEMACFLDSQTPSCRHCSVHKHCDKTMGEATCLMAWKHWLESAAEEGDGNET